MGGPPAPAAAPAPAAPTTDNLLADLLGTSSPAGGKSGPTTSAASPGVPQPKKVYSKNGIGITFTYHPSPRPGVVRVTATTANESRPETLQGYALSVAVPKYINRTLLPASGATLPPGGAQPVTQKIELDNTAFAQGKATVIKIQVVFTGSDGKLTDTATINL